MNAPAAPALQSLPLASLRESVTNPRQTYHLDELAASIRSAGVLTPLLVRPLPSGELQVVAGHRRLRAAKAAGLTEVPCVVRLLTDVQVAEAQLAENLQRAALTELEQAEGFAALKDKHGRSVADIAKAVGVSVGLVNARLRLLALGPEGRKALAAGTLPAAVALVVARLPQAMQGAALKALETYRDGAGGLSQRAAIEYLQQQHSRDLKTAPWDLSDATLDAKAGSCTACPKNSRVGPAGLFDDFTQAKQARCTDVECYAGKEAAHWARVAEAATKKGAKVLHLEQGRKLFAAGHLPEGSRYVDLDVANLVDPQKRTWRQLLERVPEEARPSLVVAPDGNLRAHAMVERDPLVAALATAGLRWAQKEVAGESPAPAVRPRRKSEDDAVVMRREVLRLIAEGAAARLVRSMDPDARPLQTLRLIARAICAQWPSKAVLSAMGWDNLDKLETCTALEACRLICLKAVLDGDDGDVESGFTDAALKVAGEAKVSPKQELARLEKQAKEAVGD